MNWKIIGSLLATGLFAWPGALAEHFVTSTDPATPSAGALSWGSSEYGRLGDGTETQKLTPVPVKGPGGSGVLSNVVQLDAGAAHAVAVDSNGSVWSWGQNGEGRLGDGSTSTRYVPVRAVDASGSGPLTTVVQASAGGAHSLAARSDGTAWAWGLNVNGQLGDGSTTNSATPVQVVGLGGVGFLTGVVQVEAGGSHSVARKGDGSVWAWGSNAYGQLGDGSTVSSATPVQVRGPTASGFLTNLVHVSAWYGFTLAVRSDGTVWGWGYQNSCGQLGDGTWDNRDFPVQMRGPGGVGYLTNILQVAAGGGYSLALRADGTAWAVGCNHLGQLGDGTKTPRLTPVQVRSASGSGFLTSVAALSAGSTHSVVVRSDGSAWTWGYNSNGQLGDGWTFTSARPTQVVGPDGLPVLEDAAAPAAGQDASFSVQADGTVFAWGNARGGHLGDGTVTDHRRPGPVSGPGGVGQLTDVVDVAAGSRHSLAVRQDGTAWAWGWNRYGQLGDGSGPTLAYYRGTPVLVFPTRATPVQVLGPGGVGFLEDVVQVAVGWGHSLALKNDGTVWAWGVNDAGQLGDGTSAGHLTPVQVTAPDGGVLKDIVHVAAGLSHSVALDEDGTVWAWGANYGGQLGDGTTLTRPVPVQVVGLGGAGYLTDVARLDAGWEHTIAVRADGTVAAWGVNYDGRLGDGTTTDRATPVLVQGPGGLGFLLDVAEVSAGAYHTVAVRSNGTAWAWGANWGGQLGDGTTTGRLTPVQVRGPGGNGFLDEVVAVSAGTGHTFARDGRSGAWAWGFNGVGELGDDTRTDRITPVAVRAIDGAGPIRCVAHVSAGADHSLAVQRRWFPDAPQGLVAAVPPPIGEVALAWQPPNCEGGADVTGYRVYRETPLAGEQAIATLGPVLAYVDRSCALGEVCTYRVAAINAVGEGEKSEAASAPGTAI